MLSISILERLFKNGIVPFTQIKKGPNTPQKSSFKPKNQLKINRLQQVPDYQIVFLENNFWIIWIGS